VHRSAIVGRVLPVLTVLALLLSACAPQRAGQPESKPAAPAAGAPAGKPGEAAQPAAAPGAMTAKFSHVVAKDTPKGKAADRFAELVNQKSGGKIQVQVFANSELYKDAEELEALQTNAIQFIAPGTDKFGGLAPQWDATALPYIFTSDAAVNKLLDPDNPVAKELFESMRPKGLIGLAIWGNGWKHFTDSKRPLKTPADFQGLKFRTSGKPDEAFVKALGGSATVMAFSEVFGALQQGVVDGQYNTWSNIYTQKFHEVQKYATVSRGGVYLTYGVATNTSWWDSLDADSKKTFTDAMKEATAYEKQLSDKDNADSLDAIKQSGRLEFYEQTEEDAKTFQQAAQPVVQEWEPRTGKDIIDKLKAMNQ
jgi:C4-dicarboxylate-binding protein DctP